VGKSPFFVDNYVENLGKTRRKCEYL
jgi:hypothetical protein